MADDFDPDAYLASTTDPAPTGSSAFDPDEYIKSFDPDAYLNRPAPEGMLATGAREAAHGVVPAAAGLAGMGYGAAAGGAVGGPVGAIVGGIIGGVGAGMGAGYVQEKALDAFDASDMEQRAVNKEENPWSSRVGAVVPAVAGMSVSAGASRLAPAMNEVVQRGAGAVFGGGMEAGQQAISDEEMNWTDVAFQAAVGAIAPGVNKAGAKLVNAGERGFAKTPFVPGRPNQPKNEDALAQQSHADVNDPGTEVDLAGSSLASAPPPPTGETTGNPQSAPVRSERTYAKGQGPAPAEVNGVTEGQIQPAEQAALEAANPAPKPAQAPVTEQVQPQSAEPNQVPAQPVVDAGFPQPGEPVAMGANDAAPMPAPPPGAAAAINQSKKRLSLKPKVTADPMELSLNDNAVPPKNSLADPIPVDEGDVADMPPLNSDGTPADFPAGYKGKINDNPTEAQKEAGNYAKPRSNDFGKPLRMETRAGVERKGTDPDGKPWAHAAPYHYGYFAETRGADRNRAGKRDAIDWAEAPEGTPERGDKHFVIDQRDLKTGKFDEHKVFRNYKDEASARAHYEAGFGDGKGGARLGAITEADRTSLSKWLGTSKARAKTKPFGAFKPGKPEKAGAVVSEKAPQISDVTAAVTKAPTADPKVVTEARKMMEAQGLPKEALDMFDGLPAEKRVVEATKFVNAKRSKTGVVKSAKVARIRPEAAVIPGTEGLTARTKAEAEKKGNALARWKGAMDKNLPGENETDVALRTRLEAIVKDAGSIDEYKPTKKPAGYLLAKAAKEFLNRKKPKPEHVEAFKAQEKLLRSGDEGVTAARDTNKIEAGIARSRRSGEAAIDSAVAKQASGRNNEEDAMLDAIDAKRGAFVKDETDLPATPVKTKADLKELPRKTVSSDDSSLAKIDTGKITATVNEAAAKRKAEAAALAGQKAKANVPSEELKAAAGKKISITDPKEMQRIMDAMNLATKRNAAGDRSADLGGAREVEAAPKKKRDLTDIARDLANDTSGELNHNKIVKDFQRWMSGAKTSWNTVTHRPTYRAQQPKNAAERFVNKASDDMQALKKKNEGALFDNLLKLDAAKKDGSKNAKLNEEIYTARENDSAHFPLPAGKTGTHIDNLSPAAKKLYEQHYKPMFESGQAHADAIRAFDEERIGPSIEHHISRITKGDDPAYNRLMEENDDPTGPANYHSLLTNSKFAKDRQFYALVGPDGRRHVIGLRDNGFTIWRKNKPEHVKDSTFEFKDGDTFKAGDNVYTMRQATTKEIEDNTKMRYYKNAGFSAALSDAQLGSMWRNIKDLHDLTQTEEWGKYASTNPSSQGEKGYVKTKFPNLDGHYMDPRLAAVFDDFTGNPQEWYNKLNGTVTKLIFWMPVAHIRNVAEHMIVGRGLDNFSIPKNVRLALDIAPKAIKSVLTQDKLQHELRELGAGMIYPSVQARRYMEKVANRVGEDIIRNPSKWGPVADKVNLTAKQMYDAVYDWSSRTMWSAGDMLLTMKIMENQRKGMTLKQAVIDAERDIPNYRVPTQVVGSGEKGRQFSKFVQNPLVVAFGRYHYGMFNSYANIIKDAFGPDATLGDRKEAFGKMMTIGAIGMLVYPVFNYAAKAITGNEDSKIAARGPLSVPKHAIEGLRGEGDLAATLRGSITLAPAAQAGISIYQNKDFRGKPLVEPGDLRKAFVHGDPRGAAKAAATGVEGVARQVVSPYGTFANAQAKRQEGEGLGSAAVKAVRDAALDIKDPSERMRRYKHMVDMRTNRDVIAREKRPPGWFEGIVRGGLRQE